MGFVLSKRSKEKMQGLHPDLYAVIIHAIGITPVDFGITQGVRTKEEQEALYAQGRTKPGKIVTWTMNSKHLKQPDGYGHAFDVGAFLNGKLTWEEKYYDDIADVILKAAKDVGVNIKWGGTWKTPDRPHFELET